MEFLQIVDVNGTRYIVNPQKIVRIFEGQQSNTSIYIDDGSIIDTHEAIEHWENKLSFMEQDNA